MQIDDFLSIVLRLMLALFVGGVIGAERQLSHKPAGLRTHMLVSFGSALFVLTTLSLSPHGGTTETSRAIQGIAAGIGFLGGGEILRSNPRITEQESDRPSESPPNHHKQAIEREEVHGLTSAAAIWVSAALGTLAGCGLWQISLLGALLSYLVLKVVKKVEKYL